MGILLLSDKERVRLGIMSQVCEGVVSVAEAARVLGVSERQCWRLKVRYAKDGDAGLVHGLRGRASNRKTSVASRSAILKVYREKYAGFGPTLACEYLAAEDGHVVSADALSRWLRAEGLFEARRKRGKHRLRRARRKCFGELLQMDGSWHDWLEGRGPWCCLMVMVDDATGEVFARFYDRETLEAAFDIFGRYVRMHGLPRALYVDKAAIYRGESVDGEPVLTQFGRAMKALKVELILANSPQAKGRVERMNGTLQDRLVKEMGLRGVKDIAGANALLQKSFLKAFNAKFTVPATRKSDVHQVLPAGVNLDEELCERGERAVGRDWCMQWRGRLLQIDARHESLDLSRPGRRVMLIEKADGNLLLRYEGKALTWSEVSRRATRAKATSAKKPITNNKVYKPGPDHPFNRRPACPGSRPRQGLGVRASEAAPPKP